MIVVDKDKESRKKIVHDINANFFVEAGAGSGKTTVLVDRLISMVEQGLDIKKICAITFTKAAANEFYYRFQDALSKSESSLAKEALNNIDLCFMGTIDAFCNMILTEHPTRAKIPSDAKVIDQSEATNIYKAFYAAVARGEKGPELKEKWKRYVRYNQNNAEDMFVNGNALNFLRSSRNVDIVCPECPTESIDVIFKKQKTYLKDIFFYLEQHQELEEASHANSRKAWKRIREDVDILSKSWEHNLNSVQYFLKDLKGLRIIKEFDIAELGMMAGSVFEPKLNKAGKISFWQIKDDGDPLCLDALNNHKFAVSLDFINATKHVISNEMRKKGQLDFFDALLYLRDMLKEDAAKQGSLIKHINQRHSYFLIDEFQDTNPLQAEIFFYLSAKNPSEDWKKCIPQPGSLFVVGDPKQSIYRFRNADVSSYLKVKNMFNGEVGQVLELTRNFRSTDKLCSWFNKSFVQLLPEDTEYQSRFSEIPTGEKPEDTANIAGAFTYSFKSAQSNAKSEEWETLAKIVRAMVDNKENRIFAKQELRSINFDDFMIITPKKQRLSYIMKAFLQWGIPFNVEGKVMFNECPLLISIGHIFRAVANNTDQDKLIANMLSGIDISINDVNEFAYFMRNLPASSVVQALMDKVDIFKYVDTLNAEYAYFALELLRDQECKSEITSLNEASVFIDSLIYENAQPQERCFSLTQDSNKVSLSNLHKVKGLQKPIVILADPKKGKTKVDSSIDYSGGNPKSYLFNMTTGSDAVFGSGVATNVFSEKQEYEAQMLDAEYSRLLYVAATRAECAMIVADAQTAKGRSDNNFWYPFLDKIDSNICDVINLADAKSVDEPKLADANDAYVQASQKVVLDNASTNSATYKIVKPSDIKTQNKFNLEDPNYEVLPTTANNNNAAFIGTLVHRALELAVSGNFINTNENIANQAIVEYGKDAKEYINMLLHVLNTMQNGGFEQEGNVAKDLFAELNMASEVYCELPFCYKEADSIYDGVIDLVYFKDNNWHIIDYKTNANARGLQDKYKGQLQSYIKAFEYITGFAADAKIYHIEIKY